MPVLTRGDQLGLPKWTLYAGGAALVVAGVTAIALVVAHSGGAQPTAGTSTAAATPSPTPTSEPVDMPASVAIFGDIEGWTQAATTSVARVLPQVGDAASGSISAYVDAPVVDEDVTVLKTKATVEAGKTYAFSAQLRTLSPLPTEVAASVFVGDTEIDVPELDAEWTEVTGTYVVPGSTSDEAVEVTVRIVLDGPVSGLGVDDVSLVAAASDENVVANPSFEQVDHDDVILNRSLILPATRARLAVQVPAGKATWTAENESGDTVASGFVDIAYDIDVIPLYGLEQGYYTVTVTDSSGASTSTDLGLIDYDGESIAADDRFGVGMHVEDEWYDDAADLASSLGIGLARNDILWKLNETTKGEYDFDDAYVDGFARLHAHGIQLLGIVNYGNELYGNVKVPETTAALAAYGQYAAAIAERFDLAGLEVFNEFNHARFNNTSCGTDASCYVPLLKAVESAVREVDADLPLIAGATAKYDADWFDALWADGGLQYADAVSFHPYEVSSDPESLADIIDLARTSMSENAGETRPIWISELGSSSKTGGRSLGGQASYLIRTAMTAFANGAEKFFWYDLVNDSTDPAVHEGNFGMYYQKRSGVAALQPKPVGYAQALMIAQLDGRDYLDSESLGDGVISYRFGVDGDAVRVVWAPDGDVTVDIPSEAPLTVVTKSGATTTIAPVEGTVSVTVGSNPVFISEPTDVDSDSTDTATASAGVSPSPAP
ncbi:MAG: hypothetical protein QM622_00845 [Microbacterium sp.]